MIKPSEKLSYGKYAAFFNGETIRKYVSGNIYIYYIYILHILPIYIYTCIYTWISYVNTICISSFRYTRVITYARFRLIQMWWKTKAMAEMKREQWTKRWNWSSSKRLTVSVQWAYGLIAQSVRASERNSVVVGSNPTQANFL